MPLISVIVPIYKVELFLKKCIDSILGQSFTDFELILVDDGSPDNCPQVCEEYSKKDKRIIVIHKENGGLSSARNAGLDIAKGKYICFVDSDDYVDYRFLEYLYRRIIETRADIVACNFISVSENGDFINIHSNSAEFTISSLSYYNDAYRNPIFMVAWNKIYKSSIFDGLRYETGKIHEDEFIIDRIIYKSEVISFVSEPLYFYRQREGSIISKESELDKILFQMDLYSDRACFFLSIGNIEYGDKYYRRAYRKLLKNYNKLRNTKEYKSVFKTMKKLYKKRVHSKDESIFYFSPKLYFWLSRIFSGGKNE